VLKKSYGNLYLESVPRHEHGSHNTLEILTKLPCWDENKKRYICFAEAESEIFITSLLSELFEKGYSPHFIIHERSFACSEDSPLYIILERLGIYDSSTKTNYATLEELPELLSFIGYQEDSKEKEDMIFYFTTYMLITVLHTFAMMQRSYMIQNLDSRCANILFKVFLSSQDETRKYFRGESLSPNVTNSFRYIWNSLNDKNKKRSFTLPNLGFILKICDFGMSGAFGLEMDDGTVTSILGVTQDPYMTKYWSQLETLVKMVEEGKDEEELRKFAKLLLKDFYEDSNEKSSISRLLDDAKTGKLNIYVKEMSRRRQSRRNWGVSEEFLPGYDLHYLLFSLKEHLGKWISNEKKQKGHLANLLINHFQLTCTSSQRPPLNKCLKKSPLEVLDLLYDIGSGFIKFENVNEDEDFVTTRLLSKLLRAGSKDSKKIMNIVLEDVKKTKGARNFSI
jgi:hypothetical protein